MIPIELVYLYNCTVCNYRCCSWFSFQEVSSSGQFIKYQVGVYKIRKDPNSLFIVQNCSFVALFELQTKNKILLLLQSHSLLCVSGRTDCDSQVSEGKHFAALTTVA